MPSWYNQLTGNFDNQYKKPSAFQTLFQNLGQGVNSFMQGFNNPGVVGSGVGQQIPPNNYAKAPDLTKAAYTPFQYQNKTLDDFMKQANSMLTGQKTQELNGYNNALNMLSAALNNTNNGIYNQYNQALSGLNDAKGQAIKENLESSNDRGMYWSTIPDIQKGQLDKVYAGKQTELEGNKQVALGQALNDYNAKSAEINSNIAALESKYGSQAVQLAQQLLDNFMSGQNNEANVWNQNQQGAMSAADANNRNALGIWGEMLSQDTANKDRTSRETLAQNDITAANQRNKDSIAASSAENAARIKADKENTQSTINYQKSSAKDEQTWKTNEAQKDRDLQTSLNNADNATSRANAATSASTKNSTKGLDSDKVAEANASVLGVIKGLKLKTPTQDSDFAAWQDAYNQVMEVVNLHPDYKDTAMKYLQGTGFYKQYQQYMKQYQTKQAQKKVEDKKKAQDKKKSDAAANQRQRQMQTRMERK